MVVSRTVFNPLTGGLYEHDEVDDLVDNLNRFTAVTIP